MDISTEIAKFFFGNTNYWLSSCAYWSRHAFSKAHPEYYQKLLICRALSKIYNYADWKAFKKRFIIQPITIAIAEPKIIGGSGTVLITLPDPEIVFSNTP